MMRVLYGIRKNNTRQLAIGDIIQLKTGRRPSLAKYSDCAKFDGCRVDNYAANRSLSLRQACERGGEQSND